MSERRRIGYILSQFPCYDETFILREIEALASEGVTLTIFSLRNLRQPVIQDQARPFLPATRYAAWLFSPTVLAALLRAMVRAPGVLLWAIGLSLRAGIERPAALPRLLALLPKTLRFAELVRAEGLEHVHAHWATYPATAALIISRLTGVSFSFTSHAHDIFLAPHLLRDKLEAAEFVLTCTANNKERLEELSPRAKHTVRVSYHGLDISRFRPRDAGAAAAQGPAQLLAVGSLLECKGFGYLIDATRILRDRGHELSVTIAGGGPLEAKLRARVAELDLGSSVHFTGYITQNELAPRYRSTDIFVLPAVLEIHWGIPNVLVEAAASGLPVITTALPSLPELIDDGVHGLVVENKNPADLADKIERLIRDPELRARMGQAARERVEARFDIRRTIATVVEPMLGDRAPEGAAIRAGQAALQSRRA